MVIRTLGPPCAGACNSSSTHRPPPRLWLGARELGHAVEPDERGAEDRRHQPARSAARQHETIRIVNLHYSDTVEANLYAALRRRIGLFGTFVGKLQPILSRSCRRGSPKRPCRRRSGSLPAWRPSTMAEGAHAEADGFDQPVDFPRFGSGSGCFRPISLASSSINRRTSSCQDTSMPKSLKCTLTL